MTDTSSLLPNAVGLSSDCMYNLKPSAVRSRSYRASIPPTNGSQSRNPGDTVIFYVPGGRRNTYLDCQQSYIKYTCINNDTTNVINFDGNGASVINRLDVFHGSNLLESIQSYNNLYTYILDYQTNVSQRVGLSTAYGFNSDGLREGAQLAATNGAQTIAMPILSGVVGMGNSKFLPLGLLCDDIRLEFTLEQIALGMCYAGGGTSAWTVTGFELELCIVELSDEGEQMVRDMTPPDYPIYIHGNSWRHYTSSYTAAAGMSSMIVPARFASCKSLVVLPHRGIDQVAIFYSIASRVNPNISSYYWRIGSNLLPSKMVYLENGSGAGIQTAGGAEAFLEIQRSWHSLNTAENASSMSSTVYHVRDTALSKTPWKAATAAADATNSVNGFAIATELESFANRNDVLLSGLNTLTSQVFFEFNVNTAATNATAWTFDFFANYDHILIVENGLISVRF